MNKKILSALLAIIFVLILAGCSSSGNTSKTDTSSNETAAQQQSRTEQDDQLSSAFPNLNSFTAETLDGETFTQDNFADYDVTVINMWTTTCYYCIEEMPDIAAFQKTLPENVQLITFCMDGSEAVDDVREILNQSGYEGITLISGEGDIVGMYNSVMYVPTTVFVDSKGNIIGTEIIGAASPVDKTYIDHINWALASLGKDPI